MYGVSQIYRSKLIDNTKKRRYIRGSIGSVTFTGDDILEGSFSYTDIAVNSADIKLGGVFVGSLKLTFLPSVINRIPRGSWRGRTINIEIGLKIGTDAIEYVPLKPYIIDEANHTSIGIDISAYDAMSKFDSSIQMNVSSGNLYGMALLACQNCGVEFGMTSAEMQALPNGDQIIGLYPDNDIETWRDLISWIAVTIGGFATIDREGKLVFRTWHTEPDFTIGVDSRFSGGSWSDFSTRYTAVTLTNIDDGSQRYYSIAQDDGLILDLGSNPLMQYGINEVIEQQARNILTAIQNMNYTPFSSTSLIDPALDLGDVISFPNGVANNSIGCVMRIDFSFRKGATIKGYGKNPSLSGARSAQDKAIAQNAKKSQSDSIVHYTYVNTSSLTLSTTPQRLFRIAFATADQTDLDLWFETKILSELDGDTQAIKYEYYLDGNKFDYEPVDTIGEDGYHSYPHPFWFLQVSGGETHYWEVKASVDSGIAEIDIGDIHAMLRGQKLAAQVKFDGNIEITDEFEPFIAGFDIVALSDSVSLATQRPQTISLSDSYSAFVAGFDIVGLADNVRLRTAYVQFNIVSEDDDFNIVSEDGQFNIVSEGGYE